MQGIKLFNRKYGCNWCLHPGEWYEDSSRYPILESPPIKRSMENTVEFMTRITSEENVDDVYSVDYISPFVNSCNFDIVKWFVPDYMHCCLVGGGN